MRGFITLASVLSIESFIGAAASDAISGTSYSTEKLLLSLTNDMLSWLSVMYSSDATASPDISTPRLVMSLLLSMT